MEHAVQDIKVSENLVQAIGRESSKSWILRCFPKPNTISLRDYQLNLCMLEFLHKLQDEIRKLIPKGRYVILPNAPLGISLRISCSN